MSESRRIVVRALPEGALREDHFELRAEPEPPLEDGQARIRTILMSIDAANRAWLQGATYRDAVRPGDAMPTLAIGEVIESSDPSLSPGDVVAAESVWADRVAIPAKAARKLPAGGPLSHHLSLYGIAGRTAHVGLVDVGRPKAGETVLVSAAAGSVGGLVGQIAKALGCRAVGIAGGSEKCRWVEETLGFDACLDHRAPGLVRRLAEACPDGVDVYFDNVGGPVLEAALFRMNQNGRVVCCGAASQYDTNAPSGPRNVPGLIVVKRLRMEGFIVMDHADRFADADADLRRWAEEGRLHVAEDVVEGLENAPRALIGLLAGENRGKRMVRVAPDPA